MPLNKNFYNIFPKRSFPICCCKKNITQTRMKEKTGRLLDLFGVCFYPFLIVVLAAQAQCWKNEEKVP